jgi:hypothetical protein
VDGRSSLGQDHDIVHLESEDKLTPEGYRKQLETNYSLKLPPEAVTPFIDARFNLKDSAEYPRWLRAYVNSGQMIYREPVVHEIPLVTQPTLFIMGADDHNAPGTSECAGGAAAEDGPERRPRPGAGGTHAGCARRGHPQCRASGVSRRAREIRRAGARLPGEMILTK